MLQLLPLLLCAVKSIPILCTELNNHSLLRKLGSKFRKNSGQNSGSGPFSGILSPGVTEIRLLDIAYFRYFLSELRRCDMSHLEIVPEFYF